MPPSIDPSLPSSSSSPSNLLAALSTKVPKLRHIRTPDCSTTNTTSRHWIKPARLVKWEDFNYDNLMRSCGGLFGSLLQHPVQPLDFSQHFEDITAFTAEQSLENFFNKWTRTIVSFGLSTAQEHSRAFQEPHIRMIHGCDATTGTRHGIRNQQYKRKLRRLFPDWAGVFTLETKDGKRPLNILPGDTKLNYKFKSEDIKPVITPAYIPRWLWPILQVFTYCVRVNGRYGYIITDKELVVLRVGRPHETFTQSFNNRARKSENNGTVEYATVKYDNTQQEAEDGPQLTLNLALWWLHLLAANDRSILPAYDSLEHEQLCSPRRDVAGGDGARRDSVPESELDESVEADSAPPSLASSQSDETSLESLAGPETSFGTRVGLRRSERPVRRSGRNAPSSKRARNKRKRISTS
jgi:hypothetical protein